MKTEATAIMKRLDYLEGVIYAVAARLEDETKEVSKAVNGNSAVSEYSGHVSCRSLLVEHRKSLKPESPKGARERLPNDCARSLTERSSSPEFSGVIREN